jgi:hypothetical protein
MLIQCSLLHLKNSKSTYTLGLQDVVEVFGVRLWEKGIGRGKGNCQKKAPKGTINRLNVTPFENA